MRVILFIAMTVLLAPVSAAPVVTYDFASEEQEALFNKLSNELRCLVCQNQAISDSNADLAKDLRDEIYGMLQQGKGEKEIVDFMVARYGDFVLYRPPMKPMTWALWFGPAIALVVGFFLVLRIVRKQRKAAAAEISNEDMERLKALQSEAQQMHKQDGAD
ncbi:MAG: cytochrome c-type biogenesis protein CcmH [Thiotrichales bacterium]|nr:MAG: cytochrome c-type biogenesis protein CcmH [Thiotrichales bacterium]